ncbi:DNA glycosylase [Hypoxylon sp. FL0543]|nr:DNA glycosylase [Hypoxylon sp. FL0543]
MAPRGRKLPAKAKAAPVLPHGMGLNLTAAANDTAPPAEVSSLTEPLPTQPANTKAAENQGVIRFNVSKPASSSASGRQLRPRKSKDTSVISPTESPTPAFAVEVEGDTQDGKVVSNERKRPRKDPQAFVDEEFDPGTSEPKPKKARRQARKTKDNPYGLTPGESPFPEWKAPSAEQCEEVYNILKALHTDVKAEAPNVIPAPSLEVTGCGEVPSVLDALLRTYLSGAVTMKGSNKMLENLAARYGVSEDGVGKASINWNNVRLSSREDLVAAIREGGLANIKAKHIQEILSMVHKENLERRDAYLEERKSGKEANVSAAGEKTEGQKDFEIEMAEQNILSLEHIRSLSVDAAMKQFTKYPGIGVKTSACVILFCLQMPCFAVDTHVHRFAKWLGWAPETATADDVFSHLEVRCPDRFKYGLHQLFIRHGQNCGKCNASTAEGTEDWLALDDCPLEHLVRRFSKRKSKAQPKPLPKKRKGAKEGDKEAEKKKEKQPENEDEESED